MSIEIELQKDTIESGYVELFVIDDSNASGQIYRLTNTRPLDNQPYLSFGGQQYLFFPITSGGYETKSDGSLARPTLTVSNDDKTIQAAVITAGDLVGARVTRIRTLAKFLDSGETPDANQIMPPDVFFVEKMQSHTREQIVFQLCSALEKFAVKLPRRQITRQGDDRYGGGFPGSGRTRLR